MTNRSIVVLHSGVGGAEVNPTVVLFYNPRRCTTAFLSPDPVKNTEPHAQSQIVIYSCSSLRILHHHRRIIATKDCESSERSKTLPYITRTLTHFCGAVKKKKDTRQKAWNELFLFWSGVVWESFHMSRPSPLETICTRINDIEKIQTICLNMEN